MKVSSRLVVPGSDSLRKYLGFFGCFQGLFSNDLFLREGTGFCRAKFVVIKAV